MLSQIARAPWKILMRILPTILLLFLCYILFFLKASINSQLSCHVLCFWHVKLLNVGSCLALGLQQALSGEITADTPVKYRAVWWEGSRRACSFIRVHVFAIFSFFFFFFFLRAMHSLNKTRAKGGKVEGKRHFWVCHGWSYLGHIRIYKRKMQFESWGVICYKFLQPEKKLLLQVWCSGMWVLH